MSSEIERLCRSFCRALHGHTGGQLKKWRSIKVIGAQRRIRAPDTLRLVVAHGVAAGWLLREEETVALTEKALREFADDTSIVRPAGKG